MLHTLMIFRCNGLHLAQFYKILIPRPTPLCFTEAPVTEWSLKSEQENERRLDALDWSDGMESLKVVSVGSTGTTALHTGQITSSQSNTKAKSASQEKHDI